jgi:hypothetical protein
MDPLFVPSQGNQLIHAALLVATSPAPESLSMHGARLNYLTGYGFRANQTVWLTWSLIAVSLIVITAIAGLLIASIARRRSIPAADSPYPPATRPAPALEWIYIGVSVSAVVLFGSAVWLMGSRRRLPSQAIS